MSWKLIKFFKPYASRPTQLAVYLLLVSVVLSKVHIRYCFFTILSLVLF